MKPLRRVESSTELAGRMRRLREALSLTTRDAGEGVGVSHAMISRYETGDTAPSEARLRDFAIFYGAKGNTNPEFVLAFLQGRRDTVRVSPIIDGRYSQ